MKKQTLYGRILSVLMVLAMLMSVVAIFGTSVSAADEPADATEDATPSAPEIVVQGDVSVWDKSTYTQPEQVADDGYYLITCAEEFAWLIQNATAENTNNYRLTTNIDMASKAFNPSSTRVLAGVLDGAGYVVTNLSMRMSGYSGSGYLFNKVTGAVKNISFKNVYGEGLNGTTALFSTLSGGTISNVHFNYNNIKDSTTAGIAVTANNGALIENVIVSGTLSPCGNSGIAGGIVGYLSNGTIRNAVNYANITKTNATTFAGIAAQSDNSANVIENCVNYGKLVHKSSNAVGGIVGTVNAGGQTISNCINYGDIEVTSASHADTGGIIGYITSKAAGAVVKCCYNYGNIDSAGQKVGGILGTFSPSSMVVQSDCANYGNVTGAKHVGGIVGMNNGSDAGYSSGQVNFLNSANYGDVTATISHAGGVFGCLGSGYASGYTIKGVYANCTVTAPSLAGALIGELSIARSDYRNRTVSFSVSDVTANVDVYVTTADGLGATLIGQVNNTAEKILSLSQSNCRYNFKVYVDNTEVSAPASVNNANGVANYDDLSAYVVKDDAFTDGTVLNALNAYALANAYQPWAAGKECPEFLTLLLKLDGANLALTSNLTMNFKMDASILPVNLKITNVRLVANNKPYEGELEGNYYVFPIKNIDAADMGDAREYFISVDVAYGETTKSYTAVSGKTYSPVIYAQNIAGREDEAAVGAQGMLEALVGYAHWAEVLKEGASDVIPTYNAATGKSLSEDTQTYISMARKDVSLAALRNYVTISANLDAGVTLVFKANEGVDVASLTLTAAGESRTYDLVNGYIALTDVHAGMLKSKLTITLNNAAGEAVATGTYAVANYLDSIANMTLAEGVTWQEKFAARAAAMYMLAVGQFQFPDSHKTDGLEVSVLNVADYIQVTDSYIFEDNQFANGTANLGGVDWTISGATEYGYDDEKGQVISASEDLVLSTEHYELVNTIKLEVGGETATSYVVRRASGAILEVYVGDILIGEANLTSELTVLEFTVPTGVSGAVSIKSTAEVLYIKSIEVTGVKGEGAPKPQAHEHNWTPADCNNPATCYECGATKGEALGHNYKTSVVAPNCEDKGYTIYTCECGHVYTDNEVPALGHTEGEVVIENNVPATATTAGKYDCVIYCAVCGEELTRETFPVAPTGAAKIGGVYYATLADALAAAENGDTIELLKDETYATALVINKAITIEGNGKTLTSTASRAINIETAEIVTINNLTIACGKGCERGINIINVAGTTNLNNVTVENASQYAVQVATSAGAAIVNIDGCDLTGKNVVNVAGAGAVVTVANTNLVCDDQTEAEAYAALALYTTANGATITATNCTFDIKGDSDKAINGTIDGIITIDGSEEGVKIPVAYIDYGNGYSYLFYSLQEAIDTAVAGETVILLRDVKASEIITINKAITLDGNGKTITSTAARAINVDGANGATIENLTIVASGERAINVINGSTNLIINNVTATAANYTVNVAGSAANAVVEIKNSDLTGLNVVNVGAKNAKITVDNTKLTCNDQTESEYYGALSLNKDAAASTIIATGVTFDIKGDSVKAVNGAADGSIIIAGSADEVENAVAYIADGDYANLFSTLQEAIDFAKAGYTIVLIRDITTSETILINKAITIEGNGKTITTTADFAFEIVNPDEVVINNLNVVEPGCRHNYEAEVTAPDCVNGGYTTHTCSKCGDSYVDSNVDALGHTPVTDEAVAPGCESTGLTEGSHCGVCGEVLKAQETINALGHSYEAEVTAPDCVNGGYTTHTCSKCGDSYVDSNVDALGHNFVGATCQTAGICSVCDAVGEKDANVHENWTDATCTAPMTCACGATKGVALGHAVEGATCTEQGTCSICGEKAGELAPHNYVDGECECGMAAEIITKETVTVKFDAVASANNWSNSYKYATFTWEGLTFTATGGSNTGKYYSSDKTWRVYSSESGYITITAPYDIQSIKISWSQGGLNCGDTVLTNGKASAVSGNKIVITATAKTFITSIEIVYSSSIPAHKHNFVGATCTALGACETCGKVGGELAEHTPVKDEAVAPDCVNTGLTEGSHCGVCGEVLEEQEVINANGHTPAVDDAVAPGCETTGLTAGSHCDVCGEVLEEQEVINANGHTWVDPTCVDDGYCSACGAKGDPATDEHTYEDGKCKVCDKEEPKCQHENAEVLEAVAPGCETTGLTEGRWCPDCKEILTAQEVIDAPGHNIVTDEAVAPTCTATGLTEGSHCTRCDGATVKQDVVEMIPHNYVGATCQTEGVCSVCGAKGDIDSDAHDMADATCDTPATCKNGCGYTEGEATGVHNFVNGSCSYDCGAKQYSYTFTAKQWAGNGNKTLGTITWTLSGDGNYWGYDGTKGQQFGSGSAPYKTLTLLSGELTNVTKIVINASTASGATTTMTVYVGNTQIGSSKTLTSSNEAYTFESSTPLSGQVRIVCTQSTSKATYIKSIAIDYKECEHEFAPATCTAPETCTKCGTTQGTTIAHTYGEEITAPGCLEKGYTTYTCSECGASYVDNYVDATGHNFVDGSCENCGAEVCTHTETTVVAGYAATCAKTGLTDGLVCANPECGVVLEEQEVIAATGLHDWSKNDGVCGTCSLKCTHSGTTSGACGTCGYVIPSETTTTVNTYANKGTMSGSTSISWTNGDVTVTNNKASSTNAIRTSDTDHFRYYAKSTIAISAGGKKITKVVIAITASTYVEPFQKSLTTTGAKVTVSGTTMTIEFEEGVDVVEFTCTAQVRSKSITVTYEG